MTVAWLLRWDIFLKCRCRQTYFCVWLCSINVFFCGWEQLLFWLYFLFDIFLFHRPNPSVSCRVVMKNSWTRTTPPCILVALPLRKWKRKFWKSNVSGPWSFCRLVLQLLKRIFPKSVIFILTVITFFASGANLHVFKALTFAQKKEKRTNNSWTLIR